MDYVHGVGSRHVTDFGIGSHATLQGYSAPHYTFTVRRIALFQHMWSNSTLNGIIDGIFDQILYESTDQQVLLRM